VTGWDRNMIAKFHPATSARVQAGLSGDEGPPVRGRLVMTLAGSLLQGPEPKGASRRRADAIRVVMSCLSANGGQLFAECSNPHADHGAMPPNQIASARSESSHGRRRWGWATWRKSPRVPPSRTPAKPGPSCKDLSFEQLAAITITSVSKSEEGIFHLGGRGARGDRRRYPALGATTIPDAWRMVPGVRWRRPTAGPSRSRSGASTARRPTSFLTSVDGRTPYSCVSRRPSGTSGDVPASRTSSRPR